MGLHLKVIIIGTCGIRYEGAHLSINARILTLLLAIRTIIEAIFGENETIIVNVQITVILFTTTTVCI